MKNFSSARKKSIQKKFLNHIALSSVIFMLVLGVVTMNGSPVSADVNTPLAPLEPLAPLDSAPLEPLAPLEATPTSTAQPTLNIHLEVPFGTNTETSGLANYLSRLYTFIVGAIGLVAAVMIMVHGAQWAAAAGNADTVSSAKSGILNAVIGIVLAMSSYLILFVINPALVNFAEPNIQAIEPGQDIISQADCIANASSDECKSQEQVLTRDNGEKVTIKPCDTTQMITVSAFGKNVQVHKEVADSLKAVSAEWVKQGGNKLYNVKSVGGYNCRAVTQGSSYSMHAYGLAVDINPEENPYTTNGKVITDMPAPFVSIWKSYGWGWGGDWRTKKDAMHFGKSKTEKGDGKAGVSSTASGTTTPGAAACTLSAVAWNYTASAAVQGTAIPIKVIGSGNCTGQQVSFVVFENDKPFVDDHVNQNPPTTTFDASGVMTTQWIAEYQTDSGTDPEFYFFATLTSSGKAKKSSDITVTQ